MGDQAIHGFIDNSIGRNDIDGKIRAALEKNCRLLKQNNTELTLKNTMLGKIVKIAHGVDSVRTEKEVFNLVVESARDIPGIRFVIVLKLSDDKQKLVLAYHSRIRNRSLGIGLKVLGFDLDQDLNFNPACSRYQFIVSRIPGASEFVNNPMSTVYERINLLLDEFWGRRLCDTVQDLLHIGRFAVVPVLIDNDTWGAMLFFLCGEVPMDILEMVGKHCGIALKNVYTLEKLERRHMEITALNKFSSSIYSSLNTGEILDQTIAVLRRVFSAKGVAIYLLDETGSRLCLAGQYGMADDILEQSMQFELSHSFAGIISSHESVLSGNLNSHPGDFPGVFCPPDDGVSRWFINAVLVFGGRRAGTITLMRSDRSDFSDEEKALLLSISRQLSVALDNAFLHQKLISRIEELDRTQSNLLLSEEKMRFTLESITDGVLVTDLRGRILQANSSAAKMHGHDKNNWEADINTLRYVIPQDRRRMLEHLKSVFARRISREDTYTLIKKDGTLFPAECNIGIYQNAQGKIEGYAVCIRDISARKIAERRLQESERQYRLIAENTNDYISMMSFSGYYSYLSPSFKQLGYETGDLINRFALDFIHPDDCDIILPILVKFAQMDHDDIARLKKINYSQRLEYRLVDKWGKWHNILSTINIIESLDGKDFNILIISHDVSDLKQAEDQLKKSYENERNAREALEHQINKRADFFRALVHELKTPLTPIIVSSETIMEMVENDTFKNLARNVYHSAVRLNTRVEELLDISRGEMGLLKVNLEPMNMVIMIENITGYIRNQMEKNHQRLLLNLPQDLPQVMGDENRLRQVMLNLLNNAMKFTPDGGFISVTADADAEQLNVVVQDTGKGIDETDLGRLFHPYNRIESDRQNFSGLGLGLSLCKQLIELHGGKIWVNSRKGKGTTFGFSLPLSWPVQPAKMEKSGLEVTIERK
ncbi:MAG: PAS domain S-box protein [Dehalococcoidales bacterium]|nr:PAS domain S-box protein [Dehalococcoidales bacterium]